MEFRRRLPSPTRDQRVYSFIRYSDMADDADDAAIITELHIATSLANRPKGLHPTGWCRNCEEPLKPEQVFCDADCGNDYNARARNNAYVHND